MKLQSKLIALAGFVILALSSCELEETTRADYLGSWQCNESSSIFGNTSYSVTISEDPSNANGILISNFYQLGSSLEAKATINGSQLSIPRQSISGNTIIGSGSYLAGSISMDYTVFDGADTDNVSATYN